MSAAVYKFSLDPSSKKHRCPGCNKKRYVRYLDNETGYYIDEQFGRCDREQSCGYWMKPGESTTIMEPITAKPKIKYTYLQLEDVLHHYRWDHWEEDNLIQFLKTQFTQSQVETVVDTYFLGTVTHWDKLATMFWYIDELERVCHGKIMLYDPITGKRIREPKPRITSFHNLLNQAGVISDYNIRPCLFGAHLVKSHSSKGIVAVCESEKTACIMSLIFPKYSWMATGGLSNIKEDSFKTIKEKRIVLYPDKGAFNQWVDKSKQLKSKGYDITVSDLLERKPEVKQGMDISDLVVKNISTTPHG